MDERSSATNWSQGDVDFPIAATDIVDMTNALRNEDALLARLDAIENALGAIYEAMDRDSRAALRDALRERSRKTISAEERMVYARIARAGMVPT